jgi:uncharacterized protein (TIGR03437 family)
MRTYLVCALLLFSSAAWAASGLTYSTYLRDGFTPTAIATDSSGNVYVAGSTLIDRTSSQTAAMVVKLDPAGAQYLYVRTVGGSASDAASGVAVDSAGNAYVTGTTSSPDFPITPGAQTGTLPGSNETRAFLIKFNPQGQVLFSDVLGGVSTTGLAVAVTALGDILVSGVSTVAGLAASSGAYSVPNTRGRPFLMELNATGSNPVFTATGIGGNALALDAAGNIYMAGSTVYTDYPTTPGAYQSALNTVYICYGLCQIAFPGTNQYVTKVDPAASKLIYSTGVGSQYQTVNNGLAVDAAGNAYVTGLAYGEYNWTVTQAVAAQVAPFFTKLDAAGAHALYSIQIGGAGVALGEQGDVYVGGSFNEVDLGILPAGPPPSLPLGVTSLPAQCSTNNITTISEGYVSRLDAATGTVLSTVLVDGSNASAAGVAFAGGTSAWLAGPTSQADTPITPGAVTTTMLAPGPLAGAFLAEANFALSQTAVSNAGPAQISCIVDAANDARASVVAPYQLLTLFGSGLGPEAGVSATNNSTTSLGGVTVRFEDTPAPLLYVSSSQINVAVPSGVLEQNGVGSVNFTTMQVSVNGVAGPSRELPVTASVPSLFANLTGTISSCEISGIIYFSAFTDFAVNADGTVNSCSHPAKSGSVLSFFLNGMGVLSSDGSMEAWLPSTIPIAVTMGQWSAEVVNIFALSPFVWQVDVLVPPLPAPEQGNESAVTVTMDLNLYTGVVAVGPLTVEPMSPTYTTAGSPFVLSVWVGH